MDGVDRQKVTPSRIRGWTYSIEHIQSLLERRGAPRHDTVYDGFNTWSFSFSCNILFLKNANE